MTEYRSLHGRSWRERRHTPIRWPACAARSTMARVLRHSARGIDKVAFRADRARERRHAETCHNQRPPIRAFVTEEQVRHHAGAMGLVTRLNHQQIGYRKIRGLCRPRLRTLDRNRDHARQPWMNVARKIRQKTRHRIGSCSDAVKAGLALRPAITDRRRPSFIHYARKDPRFRL